MPIELDSDFATSEWATKLLNDPEWKVVTTYSRRLKPPPNTENFFLAGTLWNDSCVRAVKSLHCGSADPAAPLGNESRMIFSLGNGVHGHSGYSHGGFTALLVDEVTAQCAADIYGRGIFTVQLNVKYVKMMPTPSIVLCRAWIEKKPVGRKVYITASIEDGEGGVFAAGEALFIREKEKL